jgi:regulator of telomere elongation helicase 1
MRGRAQNNACRSLCKSRACYHQNRVGEYLKGHPELGDEPIDIEDLISIGRIQGPCPYYLSRELHSSADILFAPYNYLIDKDNRRSLTGIEWENTILIFDEAHNLEGICADAASFDLSSSHLTACIEEAKQCIDMAHVRITAENVADTSIDPDNFAILKALLLKLEKRINEVTFQSEESGFTRPGPYIFEFFADLNITIETANMLIDTIDHAVNLLEDESNLSSAMMQPKAKGATCRLQSLRDALKIIFRGGDSSYAASYRVHIHEPYIKNGENGSSKGNGSRTLSWWCFNPGIAMEEFARLGVRSIILTSGTLAPLDSFALELNLPFDVRLENPHVIESNQIWVGVVPSGPSGRPLNSCYRTRDTVEYKQELGNAIVNFARIVPDGLLVFFPSYYMLNRCVEYWQTLNQGASTKLTTIWDRICKHKQPVVEPKQSALFNYANEDFMAKLNDASSSGAVFFAVCRGKVSEGLDFADRAGRAVVITGIPFAMKTDPKIRLKREYLDEQARLQTRNIKALTGEEWYVQQAARAVNQAVGRVIRHRHDYGAILLCDERFAHNNTQSQMSLWLRPHIKSYPKFGDAAFSLTRFFRDKVTIAPSKKESSNVSNSSSSSKQSMDTNSLSSTKIDVDLANNTPRLESNLSKSTKGFGYNKKQADDPIKSTGIFGQKTIIPTFLSSQPSQVIGSSGIQQSLSSMLAAVRGKPSSYPLTIDAITPANRAIGGAGGRIPVLPRTESKFASINCSNKSSASSKIEALGNEDCQIVDLSSISPLSGKSGIAIKVDPGVSAKRFKMTSNLEGREDCKRTTVDTQVISVEASERTIVKENNLVSEVSATKSHVTSALQKAQAGPSLKHPMQHIDGELGGKTHNNGIKLSKSKSSKEQHEISSSNGRAGRMMSNFQDDDKSKTASNFLSQVRAKLSNPEYKIFMDCMKGLRQNTMKMCNVLELVANLFSAPERIFLLKRFGEYVPAQFQQLYEEYLSAREK